jgi:hypothetical protein
VPDDTKESCSKRSPWASIMDVNDEVVTRRITALYVSVRAMVATSGCGWLLESVVTDRQ